eukprot:CAMPEP_0184478906 /NCGR_PEP_ID=MMETSP0113_2-20130426/799_1 /TAXON_ID=91329 /ORGANISM="Norrisiella sphaerica, Strain BC52" /LENGTH=95 /DNA_ID=CAMNT_0026856837 /DNA_START=171 /DNA_END=458 /DNA_ORIENTATION=-
MVFGVVFKAGYVKLNHAKKQAHAIESFDWLAFCLELSLFSSSTSRGWGKRNFSSVEYFVAVFANWPVSFSSNSTSVKALAYSCEKAPAASVLLSR